MEPVNLDVRLLFVDGERAADPATIRVTYSGQQRIRLDEHGDWDPILGDRRVTIGR